MFILQASGHTIGHIQMNVSFAEGVCLLTRFISQRLMHAFPRLSGAPRNHFYIDLPGIPLCNWPLLYLLPQPMFIGIQTAWQHSATSLFQLLMLFFSSRIVAGHCSLAWWKGECLLPSCSLRIDSQQCFFVVVLFCFCFVLFLYLKPWLFSGKCLPVLILNPLSFQEMTGRVHILITMVYPKLLHLWETLGFEAGSGYSWSISSLLRVNSYPET